MNTKVEEALADALFAAEKLFDGGYFVAGERAQKAHTTLAAHIAQQDATIARLERGLAKLVAADNEYESARRDWDNAIGDPESLTTEQWERVANRFEAAVISRAAALNQEKVK